MAKSGAWLIQNYLFSQIAKNQPSLDYLLIRYEDLASEPEAIFKNVCDFIECDFEEQAVNNFRQNKNHTIAGNPMRFRAGGIVLDEAWKTKMPSFYQQLTKTITQFSMSKYGYQK